MSHSFDNFLKKLFFLFLQKQKKTEMKQPTLTGKSAPSKVAQRAGEKRASTAPMKSQHNTSKSRNLAGSGTLKLDAYYPPDINFKGHTPRNTAERYATQNSALKLVNSVFGDTNYLKGVSQKLGENGYVTRAAQINLNTLLKYLHNI